MRNLISTVVFCTALCTWACDEGNPFYLPGDAHSDSFVPDGTGPCSSYTDADSDTIPDSIEGDWDADGDGTPNYLDDDSDADGISDAIEAGDSDLCTPPVNTDWGYDSAGAPTGDDKMDFLDPDSDNDGVTDADEHGVYGTDPTRKDTDGDGVTDLGEIAAGTNPADPSSTLDPDDYFVILPYMAPAHEFRELHFGTNLQVADVYFLIDTTGSMSSAIENVATSLATSIVPMLRGAIPDVQMGVGHFNDVPTGSYGSYDDKTYWHVVDITPNDSEVQSGLNTLYGTVPWGYGGDWPESQVPALWITATGNGFTDCMETIPPRVCPTYPDEMSARKGYPCFRPDALPIVVLVSDAPWHNDGTGEWDYDCSSIMLTDAVSALLAINARHVGVFVGTAGGEGHDSMIYVSQATGSVDAMGNALVEVTSSGGVSTGIVSMIETLASFTPQDVNAVPRDEPNDPPAAEYDAAVFVKDITPVSGFPGIPEGYSGQDEDYFFDVVPGTQVTFNIDFYNNTVEPVDSALVFKAWIVVLGNDVAMLDRRMVIIIVPTEGMGSIII